jgi:hypothetical protein
MTPNGGNRCQVIAEGGARARSDGPPNVTPLVLLTGDKSLISEAKGPSRDSRRIRKAGLFVANKFGVRGARRNSRLSLCVS